MWDNVADVMHTFECEDFVRVKGLFQIFHNRPQITIHKLMRVGDTDVNLADFFPASEREPDEMFAELEAIITGVTNPHIRALLEAVFGDERIARAYKMAPAAKQIHHAYLGGLIEHVLSLSNLAKFAASHYPNVDLDLLLAGVMLHDIGKVDELSYDRGFGYSTEGQLLGHIVIGFRIIEEKLRQVPDFPDKLRTLLQHMILSHHGELEYGSPKVPLFPEALLLHHLDNLDSKMECMRAAVEKDRQYEGCWTTYNSSLDRSVLKKSKFLEDAVLPVAPGDSTPISLPVTEPRPPAIPQPVESTAVSDTPAPLAPRSQPQPQPTGSFFGDKLKQALNS
jgi:3'-5' exoribonuclease